MIFAHSFSDADFENDANELCFKTKFCQEVSVNF